MEYVVPILIFLWLAAVIGLLILASYYAAILLKQSDWWNTPPAPPSSTPLEKYLAELHQLSTPRIQTPLPAEYYAVIISSLAACFLEFEFEDKEYDEYLTASVKSLTEFTNIVRPYLNPPAGVLVQPLLRSMDGDYLKAFEALSLPFKFGTNLSSYFTDTQSELSRYDGVHWRYAEPKRQNERDKHEESIKAILGADFYEAQVSLTRTPFFPATFEFKKLFFTSVPLPIDEEARFQHTWICSPSGTGKTTLLENLIVHDLEKVMRDQATIIVIDSQNEMIPRLASLVPPDTDKFVLLEPDPDYPLALNLFDNQAIDYSSSLELADFVMTSLLGADLTAKQAGIFRYLSQALQVIPNATIHTLKDLLQDGGYDLYRDNIATLDPYTVDFFETRFAHQKGVKNVFDSTRSELLWRLDTVMSDPNFRKMFSHARNRVNLSQLINEHKLICINTNYNLLKAQGVEVFGRFVIAMLLQATMQRMTQTHKKPVYVYIDECHDYIADEPKIAQLLDRARKQRVAFTLSHQRMTSIRNSDVIDALANTRVKYIARSQTDASYLAKLLRIEPEQLMQLPKYYFAFNEGGGTHILPNTPSKIDTMQRSSNYKEHQRIMRERYCAPPEEPRPTSAMVDPPSTPSPTPVSSLPLALRRVKEDTPSDEIDISPKKF